VVDDVVAAAELKARQEVSAGAQGICKVDILKGVANTAIFPGGVVIELAVEMLRVVNWMREEGLGSITVTSSEAAELQFEPGPTSMSL
jgi:hypothetical protein